MSKIFFTIAGTNYYYGRDFFNPDMTVKLVTEYIKFTEKKPFRKLQKN